MKKILSLNLLFVAFSFFAYSALSQENPKSLYCAVSFPAYEPLDHVDLIVINKNKLELFASQTNDKWSFDEGGLHNKILNSNRIIINSEANGSFKAVGLRENVPFLFKFDAKTGFLTYSYLYELNPKHIIYKCNQ